MLLCGTHFFEVGIHITGIKMLVNPEDRIKFFGTGIGDVMRMPDGHVDKGGVCSVKVEGIYRVGPNTTKFYLSLPFDHCKPFCLSRMEMVAACDPGDGGGEGDLTAGIQLNYFQQKSHDRRY